jgi:hypothetical protein
MQVASSTTKILLFGNSSTVSLHPQYSPGVAQHEQLLWSMFKLEIREEVFFHDLGNVANCICVVKDAGDLQSSIISTLKTAINLVSFLIIL